MITDKYCKKYSYEQILFFGFNFADDDEVAE